LGPLDPVIRAREHSQEDGSWRLTS
jgi:hypothetical protein